jgi:hypothetical protein
VHRFYGNTVPFYVRKLSIWGFGYLWESWYQATVNIKRWLLWHSLHKPTLGFELCKAIDKRCQEFVTDAIMLLGLQGNCTQVISLNSLQSLWNRLWGVHSLNDTMARRWDAGTGSQVFLLTPMNNFVTSTDGSTNVKYDSKSSFMGCKPAQNTIATKIPIHG